MDVVERRPGHVEGEVEDAHRLVFEDLDVRLLAQALDLVVGQVAVGTVEVALDQAEDARVDVEHRAELDLVEPLLARFPAVEMVLEARRDEADRGIMAAQHERARARAIAAEPALAVVAVLDVALDELRVDDLDLRNRRQEDRRRLLELEDDGVRVRRLGRARQDRAEEEAGGPLLHREHALHRVDHVGRGHLGAVVELHALAQLEGIGEPIRRDRVALRQPRDHLRRVVHPAVEPVVHVDARRGTADVEHRVRVEVVEGRVVGVDVAPLARRERRCEGDRRRHGDRAKRCLSHRKPPPVFRVEPVQPWGPPVTGRTCPLTKPA